MSRGTRAAALATLVTAGLVLACAPPGPPSTAPASFDDALAMASERGTPVLLDFFTEW